MIHHWRGEAFNQSPDSANEIHGDKIAKAYGFKGGLVPGVTISAYLIDPAVRTWGEDFLTRGTAHVRVSSPLYDEELFAVNILHQDDAAYSAELTRPDGTVSATAEISLPESASAAPQRRGDPIAEPDYVGEAASPERWQQLQAQGCHAFRYHWGKPHRMQTYLREAEAMPPLLTGKDAFANMGFILGISNWVYAGNAYMNPWVHLETRSQNYRAIPTGTDIIAEMQVQDFYQKKGHAFADATITLFDEVDDTCLTSIDLRAIYRLRGM